MPALEPEQPLHVTTAQLFQLQQSAAAVVTTLGRAKRKDWTAGEKHLHKRCKELLAVIVPVQQLEGES